MTVMLMVFTDGCKLPPYLIFRRKTLPQNKFPSGVIFHYQENGWMSNKLMKYWLNVV